MIRCLLAAVLFGATTPAATVLAGTIPSFTLAGLLYLGAAAAVAPQVTRARPTRRALAAEWRPTLVAVVVGGAIGPLLLVIGLSRTNAATASILLNTELAATIVFAAVLFREHLGGRLLAGAALITAAGALLTWEPGAAFDVGALLIIGACACWGLDNGVTARIEQLSPEQVVAIKGAVAGGANLAIGLAFAGIGAGTGIGGIAGALLVGALGYGLSITLWVKGARDLGAARGRSSSPPPRSSVRRSPGPCSPSPSSRCSWWRSRSPRRGSGSRCARIICTITTTARSCTTTTTSTTTITITRTTTHTTNRSPGAIPIRTGIGT